MTRKTGARLCTYCKQPGHYAARCEAKDADRARAITIDASLAGRRFDSGKNPYAHELAKSLRKEIREQLECALDELHEAAPAVAYINTVLDMLVRIK
jgi:hypothetical protein